VRNSTTSHIKSKDRKDEEKDEDFSEEAENFSDEYFE